MHVLLVYVWLCMSWCTVVRNISAAFALSADHVDTQRRVWRPPDDVSDCWAKDGDSLVGMPPCGAHSTDHTHSDYSASGHAKVALLFLARDEIHTEAIWTAFFASAAELTLKRNVPPTAPLKAPILAPTDVGNACTPTDSTADSPNSQEGEHAWDKQAESWLGGPCGSQLTGREVYQQQDLFSIYLHRTPGAPTFPQESLFHGRDISDRVFTSWGQPSLVQALRNLLVAALEDPRNSKFVLVSESCVPLRHPALFWAQHMAEAHLSRIKTKPADMNNPRITKGFNEEAALLKVGVEGGQVGVRKSSQWVTLTRMHAEIVGTEEHLWPLFSKWCRIKGECKHWDFEKSPSHCVADERYVGTVLELYNQSDTIAPAMSTFTDWTRGGAHPETFREGDLERALNLMLHVRPGYQSDGSGCYIEQLLSGPSVASLFERKEDVCGAVEHEDSEIHTKNISQAYTHRLGAIHAATILRATNSPTLRGDAKPMEMSPQLKRLQELTAVMQNNLGEGGWLGGYRAMDPGCPLVGRKVHPDLVPGLLTYAWRCDGLGFAWQCVASQDAAQMAATLATKPR